MYFRIFLIIHASQTYKTGLVLTSCFFGRGELWPFFRRVAFLTKNYWVFITSTFPRAQFFKLSSKHDVNRSQCSTASSWTVHCIKGSNARSFQYSLILPHTKFCCPVFKTSFDKCNADIFGICQNLKLMETTLRFQNTALLTTARMKQNLFISSFLCKRVIAAYLYCKQNCWKNVISPDISSALGACTSAFRIFAVLAKYFQTFICLQKI